MSQQSENIVHALVDALSVAPEEQRTALRENLRDYELTYPVSVNKLPPFALRLWNAMKEGVTEVDTFTPDQREEAVALVMNMLEQQSTNDLAEQIVERMNDADLNEFLEAYNELIDDTEEDERDTEEEGLKASDLGIGES